MNIKYFGCVSAATLLSVTASLAQAPVIDGTLDASYGSALHVQQNTTGWGAGNVAANIYYYAGPTSFSLFVGGRPSGNAFLIFLDSAAGGQNTLANAQAGGDGYAINNLNGFTFDSGFTADYMIRLYGDGGANGYLNFFDLTGNANAYWGNANPGPTTFGGATFAQAFTDVAGAYSAVTTGFEINIPYALVGLTGIESWKISLILGNGTSDYLSNQQLGSLPNGTGDIAGFDSFRWNQNNYAGDNFVVVPEPATAAMLGLGTALFMCARRMRRS